MGRFGNIMLINGETGFSDEAAAGEVVRLYLVNTANTRIFNFALRGARMKLIGGDSGRYEQETFVDEVLLSPSERVIVDVLFEIPGDVRLEHRTPDHVYDLGSFSVSGIAAGSAAESFELLHTDPELTAERREIETDFDREPDKVLSFVASMPLLYGEEVQTSFYACPMHPEVTAPEQETCPKCGMKLVPTSPSARAPSSYACPLHPEVTNSGPATCPKCGMKLVPSDALPESHEGHASGEHDHGDGLEWEDLMPEINRASDTTNMFWKLVDRTTGAENHEISWSFTVGDLDVCCVD